MLSNVKKKMFSILSRSVLLLFLLVSQILNRKELFRNGNFGRSKLVARRHSLGIAIMSKWFYIGIELSLMNLLAESVYVVIRFTWEFYFLRLRFIDKNNKNFLRKSFLFLIIKFKS